MSAHRTASSLSTMEANEEDPLLSKEQRHDTIATGRCTMHSERHSSRSLTFTADLSGDDGQNVGACPSSRANARRIVTRWCQDNRPDSTSLLPKPKRIRRLYYHENDDDIANEKLSWRRIAQSGLAGGLLGGTGAALLLAALLAISKLDNIKNNIGMRRMESSPLLPPPPSPITGIQTYLDLFHHNNDDDSNNAMRSRQQRPRPSRLLASLSDTKTTSSSASSSSSSSTTTTSSSRSRSTALSSSSSDPTLVIAGKMTVEDGPCNIAQFDLKTSKWSTTERIQLSLYNSYSGGEVYSLLANHSTITYESIIDHKHDHNNTTTTSTTTLSDTKSATSSSSHSLSILNKNRSPASTSRQQQQVQEHAGSGELLVVGAFDTTYRSSQVTYCSVGMWDGAQLSKLGEGLCNSALSKGMKITTAALAGPQDVYVAGSFQTQVWNGDRHEFVKIFNIAHYNALEQVWLPLNVGQITCSWCTVTVLALAWDAKRRQLHVAGKFDAIDGRNVPAGLAVYDYDSGHLVAHPGGGLSMRNATQDGVGTALQLDEQRGVLYVMGSFERLTATHEICHGLAAYEIVTSRWTCLADAAHTVQPTGGGNMLLTKYGLMVAGKTTNRSTWPDYNARPYTIALLKATLHAKQNHTTRSDDSHDNGHHHADDDNNDDRHHHNDDSHNKTDDSQGHRATKTAQHYHAFNWSWLPGFDGHTEPLHALANGFGPYDGSVFIAGDNLVARWSSQPKSYHDSDDDDSGHHHRTLTSSSSSSSGSSSSGSTSSSSSSGSSGSSGSGGSSSQPQMIATTEILSENHVRGAIMAISQLMPPQPDDDTTGSGGGIASVNITIIVYCVSFGCVIGVIGAVLCNKNIAAAIFPFVKREQDFKGFTLDTLTYSAIQNSSITEAYHRAMRTRYVQHPNLLTIIDPQEIFLQRIIGEGTFGRVWSARWRSSSVAVKEFVFAQAAVAGKSALQQEIVEEIIGEAVMMAILRHPNVLQLFGCSLTAQAIWIVSELCSLGSLRQVLDDNDMTLTQEQRLSIALQVAEGMTYLHNQDPPIIHRDLKSHNIFVHETFTDAEDQSVSSELIRSRRSGSEKLDTVSTLVAKIGDWGSARATLSGSRTMTHGVGTACWLAPEVIKHARSSKYSDVYGFGIVLWELATREEVYQGLETTQIIAKVANENLRPPVPQDCPWKDIMVKCWAENPNERLEFGEIVQELNVLVKSLPPKSSERDRLEECKEGDLLELEE